MSPLPDPLVLTGWGRGFAGLFGGGFFGLEGQLGHVDLAVRADGPVLARLLDQHAEGFLVLLGLFLDLLQGRLAALEGVQVAGVAVDLFARVGADARDDELAQAFAGGLVEAQAAVDQLEAVLGGFLLRPLPRRVVLGGFLLGQLLEPRLECGVRFDRFRVDLHGAAPLQRALWEVACRWAVCPAVARAPSVAPLVAAKGDGCNRAKWLTLLMLSSFGALGAPFHTLSWRGDKTAAT